MLDPWIIEEIRRREEDQRREQEERVLECPVEPIFDSEHHSPRDNREPTVERGVVVIDL